MRRIVGSILSLALLTSASAVGARELAPPLLPPAALPFEPLAPDAEVLEDPPKPLPDLTSRPASAQETAVRTSLLPLPAEYAVFGQFAMRPQGLSGTLRVEEYFLSWLALTQGLFAEDGFALQPEFTASYGLKTGVVFHPWRQRFLSPYAELGLGVARFVRQAVGVDPLELLRTDAQIGFELQFNPYASVRFQGGIEYFPELDEVVFKTTQETAKARSQFAMILNIGLLTSYADSKSF